MRYQPKDNIRQTYPIVRVFPIARKTAQTTTQTIIIDSGKEFNNETVKQLLKLYKIKIHLTTHRSLRIQYYC